MATIKSIEEKAKAYDIALDKIKMLLGTGSNCSREDLEYVFPELKESEDERIKKALLNFLNKELKYHGDVHWDYEVLTTEIVSWLNKIEVNTNCNESKQDICVNDPVISFVNVQGEKKDILEDAILDSNEDGLIAETIKVGKAKKSQRIVSAEAKEAMYDKPAPVRTGPIGFDGEPMESKPCEQNSSWSEKDDTFFKAIIRDIEIIQYISEDAKKDRINWFKSLKDRVIPQQQKWSEEDEHILKEIISFIPYHLTAESYTLFINWLKSLRPQSQWKPSDEQMEILQYLCETSSHPNEKVIPTLESIYQDLKKLREE